MNINLYKEIFAPDEGLLLDILIFGTTQDDWALAFDYICSHCEISYTEDGEVKAVPKFEVIWRRAKESSVTLGILVSGIQLKCHFFEQYQIELDLHPEDVSTAEQAESVFEFLVALSGLLRKEVLLTPENVSGTPAERRRAARCWADPRSGSIRQWPEVSGNNESSV